MVDVVSFPGDSMLFSFNYRFFFLCVCAHYEKKSPPPKGVL